MDSKSYHRVLDEGAALLVGLTVKSDNQPAQNLRSLLRPYSDVLRELGSGTNLDYHDDLYFMQIKLAGPTERQVERFGQCSGGLWLITLGVTPIGMESTIVELPEGLYDKPITSLNHAYTKLSEIFESWRISHTGNIYQRIFYRERNGKWYPIEVLRNKELQRREHEIAEEIWTEFIGNMTRDTRSTT